MRHPQARASILSQLLYRQPSHDAPRKMRDQNHKLEKQDSITADRTGAPGHRARRAGFHRDAGAPTAIARLARCSVRLIAKIWRERTAAGHDPSRFTGSAGQSFGAFLARASACISKATRMTMSGRDFPAARSRSTRRSDAAFVAAENIIVGNVCALRRDERRGLFQRYGRRTLRRAQLGRNGRGRGRR